MNSYSSNWNTPYRLSQLVNFINAIWTWGHFRRTICYKNSVLNLEKMSQKHVECFRLLLEHLAWIEQQFLSGIRDSREARSLWGMMRGVGRVRKSIHQSWWAKGLRLGLGLLSWGFKGVHDKISSEDACTLQIGSVAFPQDSSSPFLQSRPCSQAVVRRQLRRWKRLWRR